MKKRIYLGALQVLFLAGLAFSFSGFGAGTISDPYQITTRTQLEEISDDRYGHYILMNNIDLSPELLGGQVYSSSVIVGGSFKGSLNGNGFTISNLNIDTVENFAGLFEYTDTNAVFENITIQGASVSVNNDSCTTGALVGWNRGTISKCTVTDINIQATIHRTAETNFASSAAGGLVGQNSGTITDCQVRAGQVSTTGLLIDAARAGGLAGINDGTVINCFAAVQASASPASSSTTANVSVGGLLGANHGAITRCTAAGDASSTGCDHSEPLAGGLVGSNTGTINNSTATGTATAFSSYLDSSCAGGLAGRNEWNDSSITNCYASGNVSSSSAIPHAGGLVGFNWAGSISNSHAAGEVTVTTTYTFPAHCGGLVGRNDGPVTECYSVGSVSASAPYPYIGGLVGANWNDATLLNNFWDIQTSSTTIAYYEKYDSTPTIEYTIIYSTPGVAEGLTTPQMQTEMTFTNAGWDFTNIWRICEAMNYPRLRPTEISPADFTCPDGVALEDFVILSDQWLSVPGTPSADIEPFPAGDGIVDANDLTRWINDWLQ